MIYDKAIIFLFEKIREEKQKGKYNLYIYKVLKTLNPGSQVMFIGRRNKKERGMKQH